MKVIKVYKTKPVKKAQKMEPAKNTGDTPLKAAYTVRAMLDDLSKWESFSKLMDI